MNWPLFAAAVVAGAVVRIIVSDLARRVAARRSPARWIGLALLVAAALVVFPWIDTAPRSAFLGFLVGGVVGPMTRDGVVARRLRSEAD
jgi:hypothetical protein